MDSMIQYQTEKNFSLWVNGVLAKKPFFRQTEQDRYSQSISHYQEVAEILWRRFKNLDLARAGFLHGLSIDTIERNLRGFTNPVVLNILQGRNKLRALDKDDPDVANQLITHILPELGDVNSAILFLVEKIHHVDPEGRIGLWTTTFRFFPTQLNRFMGDERPKFHFFSEMNPYMEGVYKYVAINTARFFGFWHERLILENTICLYNSPEQFDRLVANCITASELPAIPQLINFFARLLEKHAIQHAQILWEWRHIASINERLKIQKTATPEDLDKMGYITIVCKDFDTCYKVLYLLHIEIPHQPRKIRDYIGQPSIAGYRALHTSVDPAKSGVVSLKALKIRIIPGPSFDRRYEPGDAGFLRKVNDLFFPINPSEKLFITVFADDGRPYRLSPGSTVLDFAYKFRPSSVASLSGARVNTDEAELLLPLKHGDVIKLHLSEHPVPLPEKILRKMKASQKIDLKSEQDRRLVRIFRHYRKGFKQHRLIKDGRKWLRERLYREGVIRLDGDKLLDEFVKETHRRISMKSPSRLLRRKQTQDVCSAWLSQMGILHAESRGIEIGFSSDFPLYKRDLFVNEIIQVIQERHLKFALDLDPSFRPDRFHAIRLCPLCSPGLKEELIAKEDRDVLELHRVGQKCGEGGHPINRAQKSAQYFLVSSDNRFGLSLEILKVFKKFRIDISELNGVRTSQGVYVFRIRVDYVEKSMEAEVSRELKEISGVHTVNGPSMPVNTYLEIPLPPRSLDYGVLSQTAAPYVSGDKITNDAFFYGMKSELDDLHFILNHSMLPGVARGKSVLVFGPKRTGKSSLVLKYQRQLESQLSPNIISLYYEMNTGENWEEASRRIKAKLLHNAREVARRSHCAIGNFSKESLDQTINDIQEKLNCPVVIILDEMTGLLESMKSAEAIGRFCKFHSRLMSIPQLMLIMVGPESPIQSLPDALQEILNKNERIRISPLSETDIERVLKASRLKSRYNIQIHGPVARQVFAVTGGNPFWTTKIARIMWKKAIKRGGGVVEYNPQIFDESLRSFLLNADIEFRDKVPKPLERQLGWQIIAGMTRKNGCPMSLKISTVSEAVIARMIPLHETKPNREELRQELEFLRAIGSIKREQIDGQLGWKIFAPLISEYVKTLLE